MAGELKHKDAGEELTRTEDNAIDRHEASGQTSNDIFYYNGTSWVRATLTTYLASQKNIVIPDDGVLQLGDTENFLHLIPWQDAGVGGVLLRPGSGNRTCFFAMMPKGTSTRSQVSLYNDDVGIGGNNVSVFSIHVEGDTVNILYEDVGSPTTSIAHLKILNVLESSWVIPRTDNFYTLGDATKRWSNIFALRYQRTQALGTDHTWSGSTAPMTAGTALTIGQAVYVGSADSKMEKAIATGASTMPAIALATGTISENASGEFLLQGFFRDDTWTWSIGGSLYISKDTAGALTQTKPSASGVFADIE